MTKLCNSINSNDNTLSAGDDSRLYTTNNIIVNNQKKKKKTKNCLPVNLNSKHLNILKIMSIEKQFFRRRRRYPIIIENLKIRQLRYTVGQKSLRVHRMLDFFHYV